MDTMHFFHWNASPEILRIDGFAIRWYGVLFALAFIVGYQIMSYIFKRERIPIKYLESLTFYVIIGTVVGARLGHCFFYEPGYYLQNPLEIVMVWHGGLASHGGVIGILLALWFFVKRHKKINFFWITDRLAIPSALGGSFIRIGNFFNHEIIGRPTDVPWAIVFNVFNGRNVVGQTPPVHPSQLYESISYLLIFFLLLFIYKKKQHIPNGYLTGLLLVLVFTARFLIEFTKAYQADFEQFLPLSMGQLLSIPFIIAGFLLLRFSQKHK
ncbi:MAG: prolipoprotein diacylglyceryl transferase [Candidatus Kapaibacteriales bacterium]